MIETRDDYNIPEGQCIGQFVFLKKNDELGTLFLMTNDKRIFPYERVSILSTQYSDNNINVSFPKPWILKEDYSTLEEGAKVLISFPGSNENPVVIGCLNSLGGQLNTDAGFRIDPENLEEVNSFVNNGKFSYNEYISSNGVKTIVIGNGSLLIKTTGGSISLSSDENITIEGEKSSKVLGKVLILGGNFSKEFEGANIHKQRADTVIVNTKEFYIGTSPDLSEDLKKDDIDNDSSLDDPKLQPIPLSYVVAKLIRKTIKILETGLYMGNGVVVKMTDQTKLALDTEVVAKLPKMHSEVGYILKKGDMIK